mmetsp:Transcript_6065/g.15083  ORF Transcript_6065/g.15083 Transcript_6065/m.15083 type:complete len:229 (-) Transcript_6065:436-1122(-)
MFVFPSNLAIVVVKCFALVILSVLPLAADVEPEAKADAFAGDFFLEVFSDFTLVLSAAFGPACEDGPAGGDPATPFGSCFPFDTAFDFFTRIFFFVSPPLLEGVPNDDDCGPSFAFDFIVSFNFGFFGFTFSSGDGFEAPTGGVLPRKRPLAAFPPPAGAAAVDEGVALNLIFSLGVGPVDGLLLAPALPPEAAAAAALFFCTFPCCFLASFNIFSAAFAIHFVSLSL